MNGQLRAVAVVVAVAAIVFVAYRHEHPHYRPSSSVPVTVLLADKLIQQGTSAYAITHFGLYKIAVVPRAEVAGRSGAILSPSALAGKVAVRDIPAGQPLTIEDFVKAPPSWASP